MVVAQVFVGQFAVVQISATMWLWPEFHLLQLPFRVCCVLGGIALFLSQVSSFSEVESFCRSFSGLTAQGIWKSRGIPSHLQNGGIIQPFPGQKVF